MKVVSTWFTKFQEMDSPSTSNAPVIVKPQGGGAGHTPGDLTFYHFFMSNSLPREQQVVSNIPSLGGNCNN